MAFKKGLSKILQSANNFDVLSISKYCVNAQMAGNCRTSIKMKYDRLQRHCLGLCRGRIHQAASPTFLALVSGEKLI
jgi:hypothetical protein